MTYLELKAKSETYRTSVMSGADVKSFAERIDLMILNNSHYRGPAAVERLKYMADRRMFNVYPDDCGHGIMVHGTIGNKGTSIAVFIK